MCRKLIISSYCYTIVTDIRNIYRVTAFVIYAGQLIRDHFTAANLFVAWKILRETGPRGRMLWMVISSRTKLDQWEKNGGRLYTREQNLNHWVEGAGQLCLS
jgi:hypothetical protein